MSKSSKDDSSRVTARRRLVRGAFTAPAVLTLYSGNAFAASSNLRALRNQLNDPQLPAPATDPSDTWIRVKVWSDNGVKIVEGKEVAEQSGCGSNFVGSGQWATLEVDSQPHTLSGNPLVETGEYAALRYDRDGVIVGVVTGNEDPGTKGLGTALTKSAGASINVAGGPDRGCW